MNESVKIKKGQTELEVAKRVYDIVYAPHGFEIVSEAKKPARKKAAQDDT